jgi:xanthine permease XanP
MARKPSNLVYGVDENPKLGTLILLGIQHLSVLTIAFIFPIVIVNAIGGSPIDSENLIRLTMVATGVTTIIMALNRKYIGSGYLCPVLNGPAFLSASILAGTAGGLPLIFGMTMIGGLFETLFSRLVTRLRAWFPAEVTGTIVLMVGIEVIGLAVPKYFGIDANHLQPNPVAIVVSSICFFSMVGFNIWGKGNFRLYSVLLGLIIGYIASIVTGIMTAEDLRYLADVPILTVPKFGSYGISFEAVLIIPFIIAALSSALKTMGDLTTCQKINDADWKRPEMKSIGKGILACGIGNIFSGIIGSLGQSVSSSNIGLSIATGATSRRIAYAAGIIIILLSFFPKLAGIFVIMPTPVMGASLIFSVSFMILAGVQIITSRMLDARKTFVIGVSIIFGLSVSFNAEIYRNFPEWIQPLVSSSLALASVSAIVLNLLMRIGIKKKATILLKAGIDSAETVMPFIEKQGGLWGARKDVIMKSASALNEFMEISTLLNLRSPDIEATLKFDEFNLDVEIAYNGPPVVIPDIRPEADSILDSTAGASNFALFMMKQFADRITVNSKKEYTIISLHFVH